jgi:hypothetical protein
VSEKGIDQSEQVNALKKQVDVLKSEKEDLKQQVNYAKESTDFEKQKLKVEKDRISGLATQRAADLEAKELELHTLESTEINQLSQELSELSKGYLSFVDLNVLPLATLRRFKQVFTTDAKDTYHRLYLERYAKDNAKNSGLTVGAYDKETKSWKQ